MFSQMRKKACAGAVTLALCVSTVGLVLSPAGPAAAAPLVDSADGTVVTVDSMAPGRLDLFTRGGNNALYQKTFANGQWTGWTNLGGSLRSAPSVVSMGDGRLDVFARSATNTLIHKTYENGAWSDWVDRGGTLASAPSAASWGAGHLDIFARGTDNALWHRFFLRSQWSSWTSLGSGGGGLRSAPSAVSWGNLHMAVFVRAADNKLWHVDYAGSWGSWSGLGFTLTSAPSAVSWGSNHISVFARNSNNKIWQQFFLNGTWRNPYEMNLPASAASAPAAASWELNRIDLFTLAANGDLLQTSNVPGVGWESSWRRIAPHPPVAVRPNTPVVALQGTPSGGQTLDGIEYAYVDNRGRVLRVYQSDPEDFSTARTEPISDSEEFVGPPALAEMPNSRVQVAGMNARGGVWHRTQNDVDPPGLGAWSDAGGWVTSPSAVGKLPDGRLVLFGVDPDGQLWANPQGAANGAYTAWRWLSDANLLGSLTVVAVRDGLQLFALDTNGVLRTAIYSSGGLLSTWTSLSEPGTTGQPAVVVFPGYRPHVFVRTADGSIATKAHDASGVWPTEWRRIGTLAAAGAPAAILDAVLGRTAVVVRGSDSELYVNWETADGSGVFGEWNRVTSGSEPAATDPTVAPITTSRGQTFIILARSTDGAVRVYDRQVPAAGDRAQANGSEFVGHTLPAPPS